MKRVKLQTYPSNVNTVTGLPNRRVVIARFEEVSIYSECSKNTLFRQKLERHQESNDHSRL